MVWRICLEMGGFNAWLTLGNPKAGHPILNFRPVSLELDTKTRDITQYITKLLACDGKHPTAKPRLEIPTRHLEALHL